MDTRISVHDREPYPELEPYRGKVSEDEINAIYEQEQADFWDWAQEIARQLGFDGVYQDGRSGGWAKPYPQPEDNDGEKLNPERYEELAAELHAAMDDYRERFLRRVAGVADVVGVYES